MSMHLIDARPEGAADAAPSGRRTATAPQATPERRRRRSRMIRAVLAGGLVLGVGAAVTLAAWNDSAFVTGSFSAGTFDLEGATADGVFDDYEASPGGALAFSLPATSLSPNDTVTAPFAVRLSPGSTVGGNVSIETDDTDGTLSDLTYKLDQMDSWGCGGTALGNVIAGSPVGTGSGTVAVTPGTTVYLCFRVTAGAGIAQGQSGTATWKFAAASS